MRFGDTPLADAEGAILAHSHRFPGRALKKGRRLSVEDIQVLRGSGLTSVVCARLDPGDVLEDVAANTLARAVSGDRVTVSAAFTGRCNLFAETAGLVVYDGERVNGFNLVDEAITLGVVPPFSAVEKGQMVATLKIIPFALSQTLVFIAEAIARKGEALIRVAPFQSTRVALVQTRLAGTKDSVLDSTREVTAARLAHMESALIGESRTDHTETHVARALREWLSAGARLLLVSGASAVVDRRDVIPAAIEAVGGRVVHFGMPVDPGNLMLLGQVGDVPVIGMPGCARSPKLNGFDWVLQRYLAGLPVVPRDIMRLGPGGLLKDIPTRPLPRAKARPGAADDDEPAPVTRAPKIAAVVLAAGQSRRMGRTNKLLAAVDGVPMLRRTLENVRASKVADIVVVTGHEAEQVDAAIADLGVRSVHNPNFAGGLSTSLATGLGALGADIEGAIVCLGDMPRVAPGVIDRLIAAYDPLEGRAICVPTQGGKRGNPVLWDRRYFAEMQAVSGDVGARHLIGEHADMMVEVEMGDDGVLIDIDTPEALARLAPLNAAASEA